MSIVFDLNDYNDIDDLDDFILWLEYKCFKIPSELGLYKDKYDIIFDFYRDTDNNRLIINGRIEDYSTIPIDHALQEALDDLSKRKRMERI